MVPPTRSTHSHVSPRHSPCRIPWSSAATQREPSGRSIAAPRIACAWARGIASRCDSPTGGPGVISTRCGIWWPSRTASRRHLIRLTCTRRAVAGTRPASRAAREAARTSAGERSVSRFLPIVGMIHWTTDERFAFQLDGRRRALSFSSHCSAQSLTVVRVEVPTAGRPSALICRRFSRSLRLASASVLAVILIRRRVPVEV